MDYVNEVHIFRVSFVEPKFEGRRHQETFISTVAKALQGCSLDFSSWKNLI